MTETTPDLATEAEEAEMMAEAQEDWPGRTLAWLDYADRRMIVMKPTDGQAAALVRVLKSSRVDDSTAVSNVLDILEALIADEYDRQWLSGRLLGGEMELTVGDGSIESLEQGDPSAMGLLREIAKLFAPTEDNREARRKSRARRGSR